MYWIRFKDEILWAVLTAVAIEVANVLVGFHPEAITDWRSWALAAVGALARAVGIAFLAAIGRARVAPVQ